MPSCWSSSPAADTIRCDIGVRDGRIVQLAEAISGAAREIDATGLMVLPGHTGRGLGSALVERCIAEARQASGLETLLLSVNDSSHRVVQLYERAGFRRYGLLPRAVRLLVDGQARYHDKAQMLLAL